MPSNSLRRWESERHGALDEIESAHASVGGTARGRRYATQQINFAYCTLLSAHFQGFCRDLYSESVDHVVANVPAPMRGFLRESLHLNRSLGKGNPHPGAIGSDFGRLGVNFWSALYAQDAKTTGGGNCCKTWWIGETRLHTKISIPFLRQSLPRCTWRR